MKLRTLAAAAILSASFAAPAFAGDRKSLEADDLARCNGAAPATLTASN